MIQEEVSWSQNAFKIHTLDSRSRPPGRKLQFVFNIEPIYKSELIHDYDAHRTT